MAQPPATHKINRNSYPQASDMPGTVAGGLAEIKQGAPIVYVSFSAEIVPSTTESLLGVCAELANKNVKTVYLLLSSRGGAVVQGITLYNVLRSMPFKLVTHNVGRLDGIGSVAYLAGEERYAVPHSTFVFNGVGLNLQAPARFEERDLRERLGSVLADQRKLGAIIGARGKFTDDKEIGRLFLQAETKDPEFAKTRGIVHEVREVKIPASASMIQLVFQR